MIGFQQKSQILFQIRSFKISVFCNEICIIYVISFDIGTFFVFNERLYNMLSFPIILMGKEDEVATLVI